MITTENALFLARMQSFVNIVNLVVNTESGDFILDHNHNFIQMQCHYI